MEPQPQRRWLAAILTAFTFLLAAGGAQAQSAPTVISVSAPDGFYMEGDMIPIALTFSEAVTVDTTGNTPRLTLTTGNSAGTITVDYTIGSGTTALTFNYRVRAGDNIGEFHGEGANDEFDAALAERALVDGPYIDDLAYTGTDALDLDGGTISSVANPAVSADLTLPVPGALNSLSHSSSVVLDTIAPTAISASVTAGGTRIDVVLSEVLTPASLAALESDEFTLGGTSAMVQNIIAVPNTKVLVLVLTVPSYNPDDLYDPDAPVDPDDPTIQPGETVFLTWTNDGDSITDAAGNGLNNINNLRVTGDEEVPVVEFVAQPDFSRGFYKAGDSVSIVVNFSSSVSVIGTPQLMLDVGGSEEVALYVAGSPGAVLTFEYIVEAGQNDDSLAYSSANALSPHGGSIQSTSAPTLAADLTLPEPGEFGSLSGDFFPVVIDTIAPAAPSIDGPIAGDDHISVAERNAYDGVLITGTQAADVFTVTLCVGAIDATDRLCAGRLTYDAILPVAATFDPTWESTLDAVDFAHIGEGSVTLTAIASDAAGNRSLSSSRSISVAAFVPPTIDPVAGDNVINRVERNRVPITGTHDFALTITLCAGATDATDPDCAGGTTYATVPTTTTWSSALTLSDITTLGEGVVTLTAIATDGIGIITVSPSRDVTVDTAVPTADAAGINANSPLSIIVTVSEPVTLSGSVDGSEFTLAGDDAVVTAVSTADTRLTLTLDTAITAGSATLAWTAGLEDIIADTAGNPMANFSGQALTADFTPPAAPTIDTPIDDDNIIYSPSSLSTLEYTLTYTLTDGTTAMTTNTFITPEIIVTFSGTQEADVVSVTLCSDATDATDPTCAGGTEYDTTVSTTTWSYTLTIEDFNAFGDRERVTLTAIATDAAGNTAVSPSHIIFPVSRPQPVAPTAESAVANSDGTSIAVTVSQLVILTNLETLDGTEFTLSGTDARVTAVSNSGTTLTLSVFPAIQSGERVTLAWTAGVGDIIANLSGTEMDDFTDLLVVTPTTAVVVEASAEDGIYNAGDSVLITLAFSEVVTVTGTPQLALATGNAGNGIASYTSGSGTTSLTFTYRVRAGDNIDDLAYTGSGALTGGTIRGATAVNLTLPTPGLASSLSGSSNVVLDATADTTAPAAPTFDAVGASGTSVTENGNRLNAADRSAGVRWSGGVEAGATVTLCLAGAGDGTGASCGIGRTLRTAISLARSESWVYTLTPVDIAAMGEGAETVTATATDAAGNVSAASSYDLIVDTTVPVFTSGGSGAVAVNSPITEPVYYAEVAEVGGVADAGITYSLSALGVGGTLTFSTTQGGATTHYTVDVAGDGHVRH